MGIQSTGSHDRETITASTTYTRSITIPAGSGRRLWVFVAAGRFYIDNQSGITFNGTSIAPAVEETTSGPLPRVHAWEMVDPPVGTYDLVVTNGTNTNEGRWFWVVLDDMTGAATGYSIESSESSSDTDGVPAATVGGTDIAVAVGLSLAGAGTAESGTTVFATVNGAQGGSSTGTVPGYTYGSANQLAVVTLVGQTTGGGDTTAPVLSSPTGTATGSTTATGSVTTDEAGPAWAVLTTSATTPTSEQIEAGQDHTGAAAVATDTATLSIGANPDVFSFAGLSASTAYRMHVAQDDEASPANAATPVTSAEFTTNALGVFPPVLNRAFNLSILNH